jgi:lipopolysaccharide transport system permease protein
MTSIWKFRHFIWGSVLREFHARYRNSLLGAGWALLQPITTVTIYTLVFSQLMKARIPELQSSFHYSIYLCTGVLMWGLFADISGRSVNIFIENANLLKKLNFPRICLPTIVILSGLINFGIIFLVFSIFLMISGEMHYATLAAIAPLVALLATLAIGIGVMLGVVNVFFRDVGHLYNVALQFGFWLTPIVYPLSILPEKVRFAVEMNPLTVIVASAQGVLVHGRWPDWTPLLYPTVFAAVACMAAWLLLERRASEMIDEL